MGSYLRQRASHRRKYRDLRAPSVQSELSEFEDWRGGIHVPDNKDSLLAQGLQVSAHHHIHPSLAVPRLAQMTEA